MNWDIKWVIANPHWRVVVTRIAPGSFSTSSVVWASRTISLDTEDINERKDIAQTPVVHEFGHAAGNTVQLGRGDEYKRSSKHNKDTDSVMNRGGEVRRRHFQTIIEEINLMIPETTFEIATIR